MSRAISVCHGKFGRATLYQLNRPMTMHAHREGHLVFRLQDAPAAMMVGGRRFDLTRAIAVAVDPWQPHDFQPGDGEVGALCLVLYIDPNWFLQVDGETSPVLHFGQPEIEITDQISRSIDRVVGALLERLAPDPFDAQLYDLTRACFDQSWHARPSGPSDRRTIARVSDFRVRKSIRLMAAQLGQEIELDAVARESGLSRPHFYKLFRKQTGITPNLYLNTLRMERAIEDLTETDRTITDIGYGLGFSSQSGFSRFFAANVGMAPTDYRRVTQRIRA